MAAGPVVIGVAGGSGSGKTTVVRRIVESLGATEGTPASGAADLIVDITTTGATLKANGLNLLADGTILKSEAHLVASLVAPWGDEARAGLDAIRARIGDAAFERLLKRIERR